jgi:integrase
MVTKTMKNDWKKAMGLAPDFPLSRRKGENRWCKKIGGRLRYFTGTADEALAEWERTKVDLLAGRTPRTKSSQLATVEYVVNRFLAHKEAAVTSGELSPRSFERYESTGKRIAAFLGRHTLADELGPGNFEALRANMSKTLGPVALGNEIGIVRSIFRFASDMGIIEKVVRFGPGFKKPSAKTLRKERAKGGPKRFGREQITAMLNVASPNMKAMVLLGINCGFGNTDCGMLLLSAIDLDGGWIDFSRPKTEMPRRCPLWPETVAAVRESLKQRPTPNDPADKSLVFIAANGKN